ncbi:hypothetical protein ACTI_67810 [Actinoplanes sp. OR16]|uniref:rod shape-determining protein n=1 Tax=Actinoplanes sp. OR16 TaxID=946334 RepID=UPI000F6E3F7A|nr:rod shape-determining protein [Actinoplanes sp. OR16]BBH70096.1 hypothetical protein ACTI_67810 [Actinoplanes sp. OR16]
MAPSALAIDLGSSSAIVWADQRGIVGAPSSTLVRRGRITDVDGCAALLTELAHRFPQPLPAVDVVVACRPVLSTDDDQDVMRHVIDTAFAPRRTVFIESVRAAAIGSGAAAGSLLVADVGAELTELALLREGRVTVARRADIGTRDLAQGATAGLLADVVAHHLRGLRDVCPAEDLAEATARGLLLVGDGADHPELPGALADTLDLRIHRTPEPRAAAVNGAAQAARSLLRHPAFA